MIPGFAQQFIDTGDATLSVHTGGSGPPLLFLHGYPQNHATWAKVAPVFASRFSCVVPDLRGYGMSSVVEPDTSHVNYSKRAMAADVLSVMQILGHDTFNVLGHDRGARVAYRLTLDSNSVRKLGIIEVIPTGEMWLHFDAAMSISAYHWPFLAQPHPLPETLINSHPVYYLEHTLKSWTADKTLDCFEAGALQGYRDQMSDPARVQAMCEDYRAGATIDWQLDKVDREQGSQLGCPLHFLWAKDGFPGQLGDPMSVWKQWATDVSGMEITSGHFAQEENPDAVVAGFIDFFDN